MKILHNYFPRRSRSADAEDFTYHHGQGLEAAKKGEPPTSDPYPGGSQASEFWRQGYAAGGGTNTPASKYKYLGASGLSNVQKQHANADDEQESEPSDYAEGYGAALNGMSAEANPHLLYTPEWERWGAGFAFGSTSRDAIYGEPFPVRQPANFASLPSSELRKVNSILAELELRRINKVEAVSRLREMGYSDEKAGGFVRAAANDAIQKRARMEVDVLDKNGRTYTYTVGPVETKEKAIQLALKMHGNETAEWAGNVRFSSTSDANREPTMSKRQSNYVPFAPRGKRHRMCQDCNMFHTTDILKTGFGTCGLVQGMINPPGTCDEFERKAADATPKSFWSYQAGSETPSLEEAIRIGAISSSTTTQQWEQMSPGMRREIVRSKRKTGN